MLEVEQLKAGGIYAIKSGANFKVAKILIVDELSVHLRVYAGVYKELPQNIDSSKLSLNNLALDKVHEMTDEEIGNSLGMGHIPVMKQGFVESQPIFLTQETVEEDELDGYYYYLNQGQNDF